MPAFETMDLTDEALLWAPAGIDPNFGETTVGSPVQIPCRWVPSKAKVEDDKGNTITLDAQVVVMQDIAPGSKMWLGNMTAWNSSGNGSISNGLMEVKTTSKAKDIKGRFIRRTLGLMRYRDTLP